MTKPIEFERGGRKALLVTMPMSELVGMTTGAEPADIIAALSQNPELRAEMLEQMPGWHCQECGLKEGRHRDTCSRSPFIAENPLATRAEAAEAQVRELTERLAAVEQAACRMHYLGGLVRQRDPDEQAELNALMRKYPPRVTVPTATTSEESGIRGAWKELARTNGRAFVDAHRELDGAQKANLALTERLKQREADIDILLERAESVGKGVLEHVRPDYSYAPELRGNAGRLLASCSVFRVRAWRDSSSGSAQTGEEPRDHGGAGGGDEDGYDMAAERKRGPDVPAEMPEQAKLPLFMTDPFYALDSAKQSLRNLRDYSPADQSLALACYSLRHALMFLLERNPEAVAVRDKRLTEAAEREAKS